MDHWWEIPLVATIIVFVFVGIGLADFFTKDGNDKDASKRDIKLLEYKIDNLQEQWEIYINGTK